MFGIKCTHKNGKRLQEPFYLCKNGFFDTTQNDLMEFEKDVDAIRYAGKMQKQLKETSRKTYDFAIFKIERSVEND